MRIVLAVLATVLVVSSAYAQTHTVDVSAELDTCVFDVGRPVPPLCITVLVTQFDFNKQTVTQLSYFAIDTIRNIVVIPFTFTTIAKTAFSMTGRAGRTTLTTPEVVLTWTPNDFFGTDQIVNNTFTINGVKQKRLSHLSSSTATVTGTIQSFVIDTSADPDFGRVSFQNAVDPGNHPPR